MKTLMPRLFVDQVFDWCNVYFAHTTVCKHTVVYDTPLL